MTTTVSKRQEKIAERTAQQQAFLRERHLNALTMFQNNFEAGLKFYENAKDKMTPEEQEKIEAEIEKNLALIQQKREEWGLTNG
jgi:hypothetical protein